MTVTDKKDQSIKPVIIVLVVFTFILLAVGIGLWSAGFWDTGFQKTDTYPALGVASIETEPLYEVDILGLETTNQLRRRVFVNMGLIYSDQYLDAGHKAPVEVENSIEYLTLAEAQKIGYPINAQRLEDIIPAPTEATKKNLLEFPKYGVTAPIKLASMQDMFEADSNGIVTFEKPIEEDPAEIARGNYESVPIQKLLKEGVVHLPYSTYPGELGHSYIVGHSSNFSTVQSPYNTVFKPIEKKTQVGDVFTIYDQYGRKLDFKVFEAIEIRAEDVNTAYKPYPDRRVVTLQASVLERINGSWVASKRWLTRGELVIPEGA